MNYKVVTATIAAIMLLVISTVAIAQSNKDKIVNAATAYIKVFDRNGEIRKNPDISGGDLFLAGYFIGAVSIGIDVLRSAEVELNFPEGETLGKISYNSAYAIVKVKDKINEDVSEHLIVMASIVTSYGNTKEVNPLEKRFSY